MVSPNTGGQSSHAIFGVAFYFYTTILILCNLNTAGETTREQARGVRRIVTIIRLYALVEWYL